MEPCTPGREFLKTERLGRLSAHGGSIDRLIHVGSPIERRNVQQGVSSFRQPDRAFVGPGLRAADEGAIAADRRNGGQRKRCDPLDVAGQSHG